MWFIVVKVEQETSAPPPKKNAGSAPALVVETSVTVHNNSPTQDYVHPHDQTHPTFEMIPGFKPFTIDSMLRLFSNRSQMTSNCGKNKEVVICINSFSGILLKAK